MFTETGAGCAQLGTRVACGADTPVTFGADAGQTYRIYVAIPEHVDPDLLMLRVRGPNNPPLASISAPVRTGPGATVVLDGSASHDPDGDPLTYRWTQDAGPTVVLDDATSAAPRFTVPEVGADATLGFTLTVGDGATTTQATVRIAVSLANADRDGDGVIDARDHCPQTRRGGVVDADGCACDDPGHVACTTTAGCAVASCDPATAACGTARAAPGTGCTDDGDPCTLDRCDADGGCVHTRVESFAGATCDIDDLATRLAAVGLERNAARLARLVARIRHGVATAETSALVGDRRQAARLLRRAARGLARFAKEVGRLEARRRISSSSAGTLLDGARVAAGRIADLSDGVTAGRPRRASP